MERKYLRAIGIIALILTLVMLAYTMTAAQLGRRSGSSPAPSPANAASSQTQAPQVDTKLFPQQLAGMSLANAVTGSQAEQAINQMHGADIKVQQAVVAMYQGNGNDQLVIYYSEAKNEQDAAALFKSMDQKVPASKAFQNYKSVKIDGREYKSVTSSDGMQHFYWLTGKRVMWVGIIAANPADVLKQVAPLY